MTAHKPDELFASTAPFYARYRPGYDPAMYELLVRRFAPTGTERVLDLGTGTGVIALELAPRVGHMIAVDPEPGMLAEARRLAGERGIDNIDWRQGDSTTLPDMGIGPIRFATMGAAFHWMDRDHVLRDLDALIEPGGAVVLASGGAPGDVDPPEWQAVVTEVRTRYLGLERRAGSGTYAHPKERHQDVLARSVFSHVDITRWDRTLVRDLDEVVGYQFSLSYSSPAQLGDTREAFEADLRRELMAFQPDGRFAESIRTEAIIATRA